MTRDRQSRKLELRTVMIELFTAPTPNGFKISIALEELGLEYVARPLDLARFEQKQDWYLALNPNGRIPTIVDHDHEDHVVFESGAILIYLAEKAGALLPKDARGRSRVLQWLMFQVAGVGPMMGQANVFSRYAPERIEYAIGRYQRECLRLFEVLDRQLGRHPFIAGEEYSIADIAHWPWVRTYRWSGLSLDGLPNLERWLRDLRQRPAVQRGIEVPSRTERREDALIDLGRKLLA